MASAIYGQCTQLQFGVPTWRSNVHPGDVEVVRWSRAQFTNYRSLAETLQQAQGYTRSNSVYGRLNLPGNCSAPRDHFRIGLWVTPQALVMMSINHIVYKRRSQNHRIRT